jgi:hypothetical protein
MATSYETLYENLLPKFKSYEIPLMSEREVKELLQDYITPSIARFHICKKDLYDRDNEKECFNADLSQMEIEILSNFLLLEYIDSNCIRVPSVLKANLSLSDFHAFSPANMLEKLLLMHDTFKKENETLLSRYAWIDENSSANSFLKLKNFAGRKTNYDI